jgi:hypothetical protein
MHDPKCEVLSGLSDWYDNILLDQLNALREDGVSLQRIAVAETPHAGWYGPRGIQPLLIATGLHHVVWKSALPATLIRLATRCLTPKSEALMLALESLSFQKVPTDRELTGTGHRWWREQVMALLDAHDMTGTSTKLLKATPHTLK